MQVLIFCKFEMPKTKVTSRHFRRLVNKETEAFFKNVHPDNKNDSNIARRGSRSNLYPKTSDQNNTLSCSSSSECSFNENHFANTENLINDSLENNCFLDNGFNNSHSSFGSTHSGLSSSDNDIPNIENIAPSHNNQLSLHEEMQNWAVKFQISHAALKHFLTVIAPRIPGCENFPKDPRSFLCTPRTVEKRVVEPGFYCHIGINRCIEQMYRNLNIKPNGNCINIAVNIDGLPLAHSSSSQVYPILCINKSIENNNNVSIIGIYHGNQKPFRFNEFLKDFVAEAKELTNNGITIFGQNLQFKITMFLFDAVAKSSVLYCKGCTGYYSCTKCKQKGVYIKDRVCFPDLECVPRTNECFLTLSENNKFVTEEISILGEIPHINFIADIPIDYMHLICLGVVKRLVVQTWAFGSIPHKLCARDFNQISQNLTNLKQYIPSNFARVPRALSESKKWKATEFRQFLLYSGPVVLKNVLSPTKYYHFLTLHVATVILISKKHCRTYLDYAEQLLEHFVKSTKIIYGTHYLSHNFHNLLHIVDDVRNHGCLDNFSNFSSENYLQYIKKLLRKPSDVLSQIVKRINEIEKHLSLKNCNLLGAQNFEMENPHNDGVLVNDCGSPQFKTVKFKDFFISFNKKDCCCVLENDIIITAENFAFSSIINEFVVVGRSFNTVQDFYNRPCNSSNFGIFFVKDSGVLNYWPIKYIKNKLVQLPYADGFVVLPLLHHEEYTNLN